jgi:uncharacterized protein (TIGR02266 family)
MTTAHQERELYNSHLIDPYIRLINQRYPHVDINDVLSYAGIMPWEAADQSHWLTQKQINRFTYRAIKLTGNPQLAKEAGQYVINPESFGFMRSYALSFTNPHVMFSKIGDVTKQLLRSSTYTHHKLSDSSVEVIVTPHFKTKEEPFQCENRLGLFEAAVKSFNYDLLSIDHTECIFEGGHHCRYVVNWNISTSALTKRWRNLSILLLPLLNLPVLLYYPTLLLGTVPSSFGLCLLLDHLATKATLKEVSASVDHLSESRNQLLNQLDSNYNNAMLASEIGHAISLQSSIDKVINKVIKVLEKRLDFDRGMILLANEAKDKLTYRAGFGHIDEHRHILQRASFHLDNPSSRGIFVEAFNNQVPFLVDDFETFERRHSTHSINLAKALKVKSFVCCPIICEGEAIGVLAVDNLKSSRALMQRDKSLLMGIAPVIGVAIRNAELLLAKDKEFRSTLQVLAASIDARDPLTAGHSEKVTEYSVGICDEMKLDFEFRECVRVAALLHDYGKIGVPDSILKKEGRLTKEEYEVIKTHTLQTRDILLQINFEGKYREVPDIAGSHHEKWDGSGYPEGLSGEIIPLGARIVAVADFFEAITSKRHYRNPKPIEVAMELLRKESGTAFDEEIVEAFIRYYQRHFNGGPHDPEGGSGETCTIRSKRIPVQTPVQVSTKDKDLRGNAHDISMNGLYVSVPENLQEGVFIKLEVYLPGQERPLEASGRIAWSNKGDNRPKPFYPQGYGVELTDFENTDEDFLGEYLEQQLPDSHKVH